MASAGAQRLNVGGVLMKDRKVADVTVEYSNWSLSAGKEREIARALTKTWSKLFGMEHQLDGVNIRFHPYPPTDFAVGGLLLSDGIPWIGRVMKRLRG